MDSFRSGSGPLVGARWFDRRAKLSPEHRCKAADAYAVRVTTGTDDPKARLLEAVIAHLSESGIGSISMRELGAAIGSSHRMLSYHFGSRDELLRQVSSEVERQQRERLIALLDDERLHPVEIMRSMTAAFIDPAIEPHEQLFFELYARALRDEHDTFAVDSVERWVEPVTRLFWRLGYEAQGAEDEARLSLAVSRGILLDLLATGDHDAVTAATEAYFTRYES